MNVDKEWTDGVIAEIDKAIQRNNVDTTTLELMKELLKGAKARVSMSEYFNEQED